MRDVTITVTTVTTAMEWVMDAAIAEDMDTRECRATTIKKFSSIVMHTIITILVNRGEGTLTMQESTAVIRTKGDTVEDKAAMEDDKLIILNNVLEMRMMRTVVV